MFLVERHGLTDHDVRVREIDLEIAFLIDGHAADDDIELVGHEGGDHAVKVGVDNGQLDAHGLGHFRGHVNIESDDLAFLVGHLKGHVAGIESHFQFAALQDCSSEWIYRPVHGRRLWRAETA